MHTEKSSDIPAAFTGMIVAVVAVLIIMFTIVKLTNAKYAGHEAAPAATATH